MFARTALLVALTAILFSSPSVSFAVGMHRALASERPADSFSIAQNAFARMFFTGSNDPSAPQAVQANPSAIEYQAMWCPRNVQSLVARMVESGVDVSEAEVLYLVPDPERAMVLFPQRSRATVNGVVKEWAFHVVLAMNGMIFDLDFTEQPTSISAKEYFASMWPQDSLPLVRSISAADYLQAYSGHWSWFAHIADSVYPAASVSTYLDKRRSVRDAAAEGYAREWSDLPSSASDALVEL